LDARARFHDDPELIGPLVFYPLTFQPIYKERVWGGRNLERLYRKRLPTGVSVGESWEITDRPEGISTIANGPWIGNDLRWLLERHGSDILGRPWQAGHRFPLLLKILDAEQKLSLQVHPPAAVARRLGGEPKTELWYVARAAPEAELYVGLRQGVTRSEFERRIRDGTVADCFHHVPVKSGDAMFLPSGRVHALGAGNVIFEIQQNSDTTYRVFDWNRVGLDNRPRDLHVEQSLACIDFHDFEPGLVGNPWHHDGASQRRILADESLFKVDAVRSNVAATAHHRGGDALILAVLQGELTVHGGTVDPVKLGPGAFGLLPAALQKAEMAWDAPIEFLEIRPGRPGSGEELDGDVLE
jgi:mannose-6-phosphate isomerase